MLVDHYTQYTWFYPLQRKSQVKTTFVAYKSLVENRLQAKICTMYSDNGVEFVALREYLITHGISHFTTTAHARTQWAFQTQASSYPGNRSTSSHQRFSFTYLLDLCLLNCCLSYQSHANSNYVTWLAIPETLWLKAKLWTFEGVWLSVLPVA